MRPLHLILISILLSAQGLGAEVISPQEYQSELSELKGLLKNNDISSARRVASHLIEVRIEYGGQQLKTDTRLLSKIIDHGDAEDSKCIKEIDNVITSLQKDSGKKIAGATVDSKMIQELIEAQQFEEAIKEGDIDTLPEDNSGFAEWLQMKLDPIITYIGEKFINLIDDILDWLLEWFYVRSTDGGKSFNLGNLVTLILIIVTAIVVILLIFHLYRNKNFKLTSANATSHASASSDTDDDVLSKNTDEWDEHGKSLMQNGQYREAIRAFYHAVLTKAFNMGKLHYRLGRTNWEYVGAISLGDNWRNSFINLVMIFERAWYGHENSSLNEARDFLRETDSLIQILQTKDGGSDA